VGELAGAVVVDGVGERVAPPLVGLAALVVGRFVRDERGEHAAEEAALAGPREVEVTLGGALEEGPPAAPLLHVEVEQGVVVAVEHGDDAGLVPAFDLCVRVRIAPGVRGVAVAHGATGSRSTPGPAGSRSSTRRRRR
jgi:hypothetical protein